MPYGDTQFSATVQKHGATVVSPLRNGGVDLDVATHIVANSIDFQDFAEATAMMLPVVNSGWLLHSLNRKRQAQLRPFSPDPRMIFAHVNLTCADIPNSDKDAIIGATLALGGMESKNLSRPTTHICALSMDHEKCKQAVANKLNCKIVLPHWFDDCFKLGRRIDEGPYLLPDPEILRVDATADLEIPPSQHMEGATTTRPDAPPATPDARGKLDVFDRKKVMLSWDLSISKRFRPIVTELVRGGGGEVVDDVSACDMFICQYRDGDQYIRAAQGGKDVGNLAWLFYLITHNEWCSPLRRLLHYPVPRNGIPGFKDYKITLSNYGGEARIYLENLITAAGATFTKTMKAENTHLITARANSEKCEAAKDWNINMVNHLWIEESYARCEVQSLANTKYLTFPPRTNLGEVIGQTFIDEDMLREKFYPRQVPSPVGNRKRKAGDDVGAVTGSAAPIDVLRDDAGLVEESVPSFDAPAPRRAARDFATPARRRHVPSGKENDTPSVVSTGSRSAKEKAALKLHSLAPDIALYEKEKKRTAKDLHAPWGGKRAANQYEREREAAKGSSPAPETADEEDEGAKRPSKRPKASLPAVDMKIILTGFTRWINSKTTEDADRVSRPLPSSWWRLCSVLTRRQRKLRNLGILIVQEGQPCDYLAAPGMVRTTKFLTTLARGPEVIDSKYIDDVLKANKLLDTAAYLLEDARGDVDLQKSVKRARANKGRLLWNVPIYCTDSVKNGVGCYQAIAKANGAIFKVYRARSGTTIKPTTAEEDGGAAPEPVYLLTSNSSAERALWPKFEQMAREGNMEPRVVTTDWLLEAALKQETVFRSRYLARKAFGKSG